MKLETTVLTSYTQQITSQFQRKLTNHISPSEDAFLQMLPKISQVDKQHLTSPHSELEIKEALWNIAPYKTPGEDG